MARGNLEKDETGQVSRHQITKGLEHHSGEFGFCTESKRPQSVSHEQVIVRIVENG